MTKKILSLMLLGLLCSIGNVWGAGTAIASLNFSEPTTLPSSYTVHSTETTVIVEVDSKNVINVCKGGGSTAPTFSSNNSAAPSGGKRWMAFQPDANCTVKLKVMKSNDTRTFYLLDKDHSTTSNPVSSYAPETKDTWYETWEVALTAGTWYALIGSGSNFYIASMQFTAASTAPSISADNVSILATATSGSIAYTVNNPVTGGAVTAAKKGTESWLKSVGTETSSPISFKTEANTGAERSATVTLTYTYTDGTEKTVTKDVTITQAAKTYAITYNHGTNGSGTIAAGTKSHGVAFTLSSDKFSRSGYEQTGWATEENGSKAYDLGGSYTDNAAIELFPVWEAALYTVTYNVNGGGSCATESATQASSGEALTLPTPTWSGYTFDGWYNAGSKIGDAEGKYTPAANITLYAKWTDNTEGKLFSYIDGIYGDKYKAFDNSGWVSADGSGKSKTFTDATTGAQFVVTVGGWDNKTNSISALAKYFSGTTSMKVVIPSGYKATVKIWYNSYSTAKYLKIDGVGQTAPTTTFANDNTNAQVESNLVAVEVTDKIGDVVLTSQSDNSNNNIYIARVAVTSLIPIATATIGVTGWTTFASSSPLDLSNMVASSGTATAYYVSSASSSVHATSTTATIEAGTGILLKGTAGATVSIAIAESGSGIEGNKLVGCTTSTPLSTNANYYVMVNNSGTAEFQSLEDNGATIPAGKAYLNLSGTPAPGRLLIVEEENNATSIETISSNDEVVKFFENGQLYIKRDGVVYDVTGRVVK